MPSLPAYEAYLRYRYYQWRFTREDSQRSRECLEQALALDPGFALPYVGLADFHLALASVGAVRALEAMPRARELATRALEIDPDLPEAHAMLGIVAGVLDFDWPETERRFRLAVAREPLSPHLRQWNVYFHLFSIGRAAEGKREHDRVIEEDPLSQMWRYTLSLILHGCGKERGDRLANAIRAVSEGPGLRGERGIGLVQRHHAFEITTVDSIDDGLEQLLGRFPGHDGLRLWQPVSGNAATC